MFVLNRRIAIEPESALLRLSSLLFLKDLGWIVVLEKINWNIVKGKAWEQPRVARSLT